MDLNKYKIKQLEDDDLKPEETLADVLSQHTNIEVPIGQGVFGLFYILVGLILSFFLLKSIHLQILQGEHFSALANRSAVSAYPLSALRGIIYDSQGRPLVENVPVFDLIAAHSSLPARQSDLEAELDSLAPVIGFDADALAQLFKENKDNASFVVKQDISKEELLKIEAMSLAGIYTVANSKRHYIDSPAASHLLGYTAMVSADDIKQDSYYAPTDRIGRLGLEAEYEDFLRGDHRFVDLKNMSGGEVESAAGNNLVLNINQDVQNQLYKSLQSVFSSAGVRRGAAIAQNPKTGAVLGLVSMPVFDNNLFESSGDRGGVSSVAKLLNNTDHPLLDRVIGGRYSPGSTIKPLLALAGLKEAVVTPSTLIFANGSINVRSEVDPNVFYTFRDWKVHGWTDIRKAIANSVDVYFYTLGGGYGSIKGLGIDRISNYIKGLGADKITGIDLPGEISGFVPSKEWKKETKGEGWYIGDTYNISIGQGDLLVTPLWLNTYIGAIANGGKLMKPYLIKEIKGADGKIIKEVAPEILVEMPFDKQTIDIVREGMRQTVISGTATLLQDLPVPVAAKTGTAQVTGRGLNSLFAVFGPYDNPEIVVTVLVENINQSQGLAIRVANDFLLWYLNHRSTEGSGNTENN